jgi:ProP effector
MQLHRTDRDAAIRDLAVQYPGCFFEEPTLRRPLKNSIVDDLGKDNAGDRGQLERVLDWYRSDFGYQRSLIAGAEKVDLNGKKAGTVTAKEQEDAHRYVRERQKELAERRAARVNAEDPVPRSTTAKEQMNGHENMISKTPPPPSLPSLRPSLVVLQEALVAVNGLLTDKRFESMRGVLVTAALKEVIAGAQALIGSLQGKEVQS